MKKQLLLERLPLIAFSCVIIGIVSYISVTANSPEVWSPLSVLLLIPLIIFFGDPVPQIVLLPILAFIVISYPVLCKNRIEKVPLYLHVLIGATAIFATYWFVKGFNYGLQFQGRTYVFGLLFINIAFASALIYLGMTYKKSHKWQSILLISALETIWLFAYAFPYFGELP